MVLFGGLTESLFFFFPFCGIAAQLSSEGQCILSLCVGGFLKTNSFRVATCARFFLHKGQQYHLILFHLQLLFRILFCSQLPLMI